ncbi:glycoside hydrolase family 2 protein [Gemmiger sp.]
MQSKSFNQGWHFWQEGTERKAEVTLPHDAMLNTQRNPQQAVYFLLAGFEGGVYCYEKEYIAPSADAECCTILQFDGVYCDTTVYVNDVPVTRQFYGFTEFAVDITDALHYGESNRIKVVANVPKDGHNRWYTGGGIYRPVKLYVAPKQHIELHGVKVTTLGIDPAVVQITTAHTGSGTVRVSVWDGETCVAKGSGEEVTLTVPDAKLWDADHPNLYTAKAELYVDGALTDTAETRFGIRTIAADPAHGLLINGQHTFLRGGCIHVDNGVIGVVNNDATELHRAKAIKAAGFNAVRSAHHPMSESLMKACDEVGLYVMDEAFDYWYRPKTGNPHAAHFLECYREDAKAMVETAYNHPCVILYSIGNEIPEAGSVKGVRIGKSIVDAIHAEDKTRLTCLCPSVHWLREYLDGTEYLTVDEDEWMHGDPERIAADWKHYARIFMGTAANIPDDEKGMPYPPTYVQMDEDATKNLYPYLDVPGYNYYEDNYATLHRLHPERVLLGTETRADRVMQTMRYAKENPHLIGDFIWTLQDHLGEANCCNIQYGNAEFDPNIPRGMQGKSYPWLVNYGGMLDLAGRPYPALHRLRIAYGLEKGIWMAAQPPIHDGTAPTVSGYRWTDSVEGWTFEGYEGKKTFLDVYSDAAEVEVFVNGVSLGRKAPDEFWAKFACRYEPGRVTAVGYDAAGNTLYTGEMVTAGPQNRITVSADRTELTAGGEDFCFLDIAVTDENGTLKLLPEHEVSIAVQGAATLQGFGSAYHLNEENFNRTHHKTYMGRLQAGLRSGAESGEVTVTLTADGMQPTVLTLYCK